MNFPSGKDQDRILLEAGLNQGWSSDVAVSDEAMQRVRDAVTRFLRLRSQLGRPDDVVELLTFFMCAMLREEPLSLGRTGAGSLALCRQLATVNGHELDVEPDDEEWALLSLTSPDNDDTWLDRLRMWVRRNLYALTGDAYEPLPGPHSEFDQQINALVAVPMTAEPGAAAWGASDAISSALSALGFRVAQPAIGNQESDASTPDLNVDVDVRDLARADVVIIDASRFACGLGNVFELARNADATIILAVPFGTSLTPWFRGRRSARVHIVQYKDRADLPVRLAQKCADLTPELLRHVESRVQRRGKWLWTLASLQRLDLEDLTRRSGLTRDSIAEALSSVDHLATTAADVVARLVGLLPKRRQEPEVRRAEAVPPTDEVSEDEQRWAAKAAEHAGWSATHLIDSLLEERRQRHVARANAYALRPTPMLSVDDWISKYGSK